jgi:hypothetical protein
LLIFARLISGHKILVFGPTCDECMLVISYPLLITSKTISLARVFIF